MTESRKRSRKSKLQVREDDCEFEVVCDDTNNDVQHLQLPEPPCSEPVPRQGIVKYYPEVPFIPDHDYCWPFTASMPFTYSNPFKTNNIKLPRCTNTSTIVGLTRTNSDNQGVKIEIEQYHIPEEDLEGKMEVNINNYKGKDDGKIRMCKYVPGLLFKASKQIAATSNNFADKILDIEMRNLWGNVLYTPNEVPPQDKKLQVAICAWQTWYSGSRLVREAPLFYQCHICELAWWRLQPFRDHIRNHDSAKLIVSMKEHLHESFIIASYEIVNKLIYIPIDDGDCYRCGENVDFHKENFLAYTCSRCSKTLYTCTSLRDHESVCLYVNLFMYNISVDRQCTICKHVLSSISLKEKHMMEAHSVRSDIPVQNIFKICVMCGEKYFTFTMHNCCKSGRNCSCEHCCRKFASTKLSVNHILGKHNRPSHCRICNVHLKAKCQEMEHLVENHMSSYRMVFKCTICSEQNLLFMDEKSITLHRQLWHQKKFDKRRLFFEKMLVPKSCLDDDCVEEAVLTGTGPKKQSQKKMENKKVDDPSLPSKSFSVLTADVNVTVDEIDVKKEPMEVDENEEVDYEEMLLKMFNQSPKKPVSKAKVTCADNKTEEAAKYDHAYKLEEATEFDYSSVKVKAEPIDDIDIIENPVEEVQIKTEPFDPSEIDEEMMEDCNDFGEATVKIERNDEPDDFAINAPTSSEDPTGGKVPTDSRDPAGSEDPTDSRDPTGSKVPRDSRDPAGSKDPTDSRDPTGSKVPRDSRDPAGSEDPTDSRDPTGSKVPRDSRDPAGSKDPTDSRDPTGSKDPAGSKDPSSSNDPTGSTDPTGSKDPAGSKDPSSSNDPTGSRDPTGSKDPAGSKDPSSSNDPIGSQAETDYEDELIIKEEFDDTITAKLEDTSTSSEPNREVITELDMFRDVKKKKIKFNYEYSIEVIDSKGNLKQKKMYTCRKCGYTAHHKKYRIHMDTKCLISPGIDCSYPCSLCGLTFVMFKNYVLHFEKHGYNLRCCFVCGANFEVEFKFLSHMHRHIKSSFVGVHMLDKSGEEVKRSQKRVTCMKCKETVDQDTMFGHWEKHLELKEIKSDDEEPKLVIKEEPAPELTVDCERVTMNNKELEPAMLKLATDHLQIDTSEKECIICYRVFARRYDLKRHIVEHLLMDAHMKKIKYKNFRCQICSEEFPQPERYKFHMRGHGNMPIFMCELCNKTFSDSSNFAKHKKTHNVRCVVCDICKKKFHSKAALAKHIEEHSSKPLTHCMFCPKTFHSKTSYKKHKYQVHQKPRYRCILCDVFFMTVQSKWDHDWEVHQVRKQAADCPICLKSFRKFTDVRVHARSEHNADVNVIKSGRIKGKKKNLQLFKVQDRKRQKETLMVCE